MIALFILVVSGVVCSGCNSPTEAQKAPEDVRLPVLVKITDETEDVIFSYSVDKRRKQARSISEIPESARATVLVTPLAQLQDRSISKQHLLMYDLRKPNGDGTYPGQVVTRADFDARLSDARQKKKTVHSKAKASGHGAAEADGPVIMYSTDWCGYCRKARKFMTRKKIEFVEKDIEKDPDAARELAQKRAAANLSGGGVPVFDVRGQLIQGFDKNALLKLAQKNQ